MEKRAPVSLAAKSVLLVFLILIPLAFSGKRAEPECVLFLRSPNMMSVLSTNPYGLAARCLPWRGDLWEQAAKQAEAEGDFFMAAVYLERLGAEAARLRIRTEQSLSVGNQKLLANAYLQQGKFEQAAETMLGIASQGGLDESLAEEISSLYLKVGDYPSATRIWKELKAIEPNNIHASYQLGLLLTVQDPEAALPYLEEAAHSDLETKDTAEQVYKAISGSAGSEPAYQLVAAGRVLAAAGEWRLAAEAFQQATLLQPGYAEAWAFLGEARQHGSSENSTENQADAQLPGFLELEKAVDLDPKSIAAHTLLALFYYRHGDLAAARDEIELSLELSPNNPVLVSQHASLLAASGKLDDAWAEYQRAASLAPHDPAYPRQAAAFSLDYSYQVEQIAIPIARQLVDRYPDSAVDLDLLAQALIKTGDLDEAESLLTRAFEIDPKNASVQLNLGLIALLRGKPEASREFLQAAIQLDPGGAAGEQARRLLEGGSP